MTEDQRKESARKAAHPMEQSGQTLKVGGEKIWISMSATKASKAAAKQRTD
jgi:hypothetical protein